MIKTNIKMRVTPEQSAKVQEICFKNGIIRGLDKIDIIDKDHFLFIFNDRVGFDNISEEDFFNYDSMGNQALVMIARLSSVCLS